MRTRANLLISSNGLSSVEESVRFENVYDK